MKLFVSVGPPTGDPTVDLEPMPDGNFVRFSPTSLTNEDVEIEAVSSSELQVFAQSLVTRTAIVIGQAVKEVIL